MATPKWMAQKSAVSRVSILHFISWPHQSEWHRSQLSRALVCASLEWDSLWLRRRQVPFNTLGTDKLLFTLSLSISLSKGWSRPCRYQTEPVIIYRSNTLPVLHFAVIEHCCFHNVPISDYTGHGAKLCWSSSLLETDFTGTKMCQS